MKEQTCLHDANSRMLWTEFCLFQHKKIYINLGKRKGIWLYVRFDLLLCYFKYLVVSDYPKDNKNT